MPDILKSATDKNAIRLVLGVDTNDVSDTVLDSVIGIVSAEIQVKERVTNWAAVLAADDEDTTRLQLGTIYLTAVSLIPRLRQILRTGEKIAELQLGRIDWNTYKEELLGLANEMLGEIGGATDDVFTLFTVAGPSRQFRKLRDLGVPEQAEFQNV